MFAFSRFSRYFLEVAKVGSIRKASDTLNVSPSAIDRQILAAEEEYGAPLFERLPSGLRLTAAGELLLTYAKRWTKENSEFLSQLDDLSGLRRGHVKIAVIEALANGFIPDAVRDLHQNFPGVTCQLMVVDNIEVAEMIKSNAVDFGLMLSPVASKGVSVLAFREVGLGFVVRADHPLAELQSARFNRCLGYPIIAPTEPLALNEQVVALQAATGISIIPCTTTDNIQMLKSLILRGVGVGILTDLDVMEEVKNGTLRFIPIKETIAVPIPLALCVASARQLSYAATQALNRIQSVL